MLTLVIPAALVFEISCG